MAFLYDAGPLPDPPEEEKRELATFEDLRDEYVCFREEVGKRLARIEETVMEIKGFLDNSRRIFDEHLYHR